MQDHVLTNLNDLMDIAPDVLLSAQDINDAGQITGEVRAFIATPVDFTSSGSSSSTASAS
jgi:hypothetical protein